MNEKRKVSKKGIISYKGKKYRTFSHWVGKTVTIIENQQPADCLKIKWECHFGNVVGYTI